MVALVRQETGHEVGGVVEREEAGIERVVAKGRVVDVALEVAFDVAAAAFVMLMQIFRRGFGIPMKMLFKVGQTCGFRRDETDVDSALQPCSDDFGASSDNNAASEPVHFEDGVTRMVEDGPH